MSLDGTATLDAPATTEPLSASPRRLRLVSTALRRLSRNFSWVEPEIEGLRHHVSPGDVCLDVGAEYGLYSFGLSALAGPSGRVVAVEPNPSLSRWLKLSARVLGVDTVSVVAAALGDHVGSTELSVPRRNFLPVHGRAYVVAGASGDGANSEFASSSRSPVRIDTVDEMCLASGLDRVDFIKADVEGAELAVLQGALATLRVSRPKVLLEIEQRHLDRYGRRESDVVDFMRAEGYSMHRWVDRRWEPVAEVTAECRNYLFMPQAPMSLVEDTM